MTPNRPVEAPPEVNADERDARAADRDGQARDRDAEAAKRDRTALGRDTWQRRVHDDGDPGFADRFQSAGDRDDAAGDRADALADRLAARLDRDRAAADRAEGGSSGGNPLAGARGQQALEDRAVIGQAQGLLMADMGLTPEEAFDVLRVEAKGRSVRVLEVATEIVQGHRRERE